MDFQSVLIEALDSNGNEVYKNAGLLFNGYIITTFTPSDAQLSSDFEKISKNASAGILIDDFDIANLKFVITFENSVSEIRSCKANFIGYFISEKIRKSVKNIFRFWSINAVHNYNFNTLSLFVVLKLDNCLGEFEKEVKIYLSKASKKNMVKGQKLECLSAAFANRNFLNHYSEGIVSNILGIDKCLIFSDLPLTPGCEGNPVFSDELSEIPIGIVISTTNWWKGEWLNFTVIADLRQVLMEIGNIKLELENQENSKILNIIESSLFQIYNGTIWGTAILIDEKNGIFLTNAHVVESNKTIPLHSKKEIIYCNVIYSSPKNCHIDVAILKSNSELDEGFYGINLCRKKLKKGDSVYAAGFPIFAKESNTGPTITKGCITHIHPEMIKTTCSVYRGASGGAILDEEGGLIALIVCNAETKGQINMVYSKFNMNIPVSLLIPFIRKYIENGDIGCLGEISSINARPWGFFSKL